MWLQPPIVQINTIGHKGSQALSCGRTGFASERPHSAFCSCVARVPHFMWSTTQRLPLLAPHVPVRAPPGIFSHSWFLLLFGLRPARGPGVPWLDPMLGLRPARRLGGACTRTHKNIMILAAPTSSKRFAAIGWVASDPTPLLVCMVSMPP